MKAAFTQLLLPFSRFAAWILTMSVTFPNNSKPISYPQHCPTADPVMPHIFSWLSISALTATSTASASEECNCWRQYWCQYYTIVKIPPLTIQYCCEYCCEDPPIDKSIVNTIDTTIVNTTVKHSANVPPYWQKYCESLAAQALISSILLSRNLKHFPLV